MLSQIEISTTVILQIAFFPLLGALWRSINRRIDRLENTMNGMPVRLDRMERMMEQEKTS